MSANAANKTPNGLDTSETVHKTRRIMSGREDARLRDVIEAFASSVSVLKLSLTEDEVCIKLRASCGTINSSSACNSDVSLSTGKTIGHYTNDDAADEATEVTMCGGCLTPG